MEEWIKLSNHYLDQLLIKNKRKSKGDQRGGMATKREGLGPFGHATRGEEERGGAGGLGSVSAEREVREREWFGWGERKRREEEGRGSDGLLLLQV